MGRVQKSAFLVFISLACLYLLASLLEYQGTLFFTKPLLLIPLIAAAATSSMAHKKLLAAALLCCWGGDVLLLFAEVDAMYFMAGLISFLIGHIFYILLFIRLIQHNRQPPRYRPVVLMAIVVYLIVFYMVMHAYLRQMLWPVMLYAVVISTMLYAAVLLAPSLRKKQALFLILGAAAFVVSDTILAINKFYTAVPLSGFLIMSTYIFAQGAIVWAMLTAYLMTSDQLQTRGLYAS